MRWKTGEKSRRISYILNFSNLPLSRAHHKYNNKTMITAAPIETVHLHFVEHLNPLLCHYTLHDVGLSILHTHESALERKKKETQSISIAFVLNSGSSGQGLSSSLVHCIVVWAKHVTLTAALSTQDPVGNPVMD